MPVDVPREDSRKRRRNVARADDVRSGREAVIAWPHGGTLDTMVQAEQADVGRLLEPARSVEQRAEASAHVMPFIRKARERDARAAHLDAHSAWAGKNVDVGMSREAEVRQPRTLVIPWNDADGDPAIGDPPERLERLVRERWHDRRPIEYVAGVNDDVHFTRERGLQRPSIVRQEIVAATSLRGARPQRQIETEMRVCQKQNPDGVVHHARHSLPERSEHQFATRYTVT